LGGVAAMCLGLLISATVSSSEKAMALIPVVFIVMWLFSGMAVDLQSKPVMRILGYATSANWSMSLAASSTHLYEIEARAAALQQLPSAPAGEPAAAPDARWEPGFKNWLIGAFALALLASASLAAANRVLARKEPFARRRSRWKFAVGHGKHSMGVTSG
jgi:ABC-type transport system involved in multi-copper enzyme maturation permease subunit